MYTYLKFGFAVLVSLGNLQCLTLSLLQTGIKKTGSEAESESENEKSSAQSVYEFQNITNAEDYIYKEELDDAQRHLSNVRIIIISKGVK